MSKAFSKAMALESVGQMGRFDAATGTYSGVTDDELVEFARTIAYKVFHNIKNGYAMSKEDDPLTVDGVSASEVWAHHYHFAACQGAKCGCIDGYSHSPECVVEAAACQGWLNTPEAVDALLKVMVDRFLGWKLPKDFAPDCHVHFDREAADAFVESWPSGTNLLHAGQAMEMFKHCLPAELIIPERAAEGVP